MPPKKSPPAKKSAAKKAAPKKKAAPAKPKSKKTAAVKKPAKSSPAPAKVSLKSSSASNTSYAQWKWTGDDNITLHPFNVRENQIIEDAYTRCGGAGKERLSYNNWNYEIDFTALLQKNLSTGRTRVLVRETLKASTASSGKVKVSASGKRQRTIMKGRGVVDPLSGKVDSCHVFEQAGTVFQCTLNQTNISTNNNKFYVLQLLEEDDGSCFHLFTRWGRVGVDGQTLTESFPNNLSAAVAAFKKKFHDKTLNSWDNRDNFVKHPDKYHLMSIDYGVNDDDDDSGAPTAKKAKREVADSHPRPVQPSALSAPVQELMKLIGSKDTMVSTMQELDIDTNRMPLGKISKSQVKQAFEILKSIEDELKKPNPNVQEATGQFYTLIPHDFGFRRPPLIDSVEAVKEKAELLEALGQMEIATKLLDSASQPLASPKHHLDRTYDSLKCEITALDKNDPEFKRVVQYAENTKGKTHTSYKLVVEQVFKIKRESEDGRYEKKYKHTPNKQLLWHGSRMTNYMGILSQGLRIAPPEAPVTGYMFGKGIYLADVCTKSANYCNTTRTNSTGLMLLCEAALGKQKEYLAAHYMEKPAAGFDSTKGVGEMFPDPSESQTVDGVVWPMGKMTSQKSKTSLLYPEYIVYDVDQCRIRYLVQMKFNYK